MTAQHPLLNVYPYGYILLGAVGFPVVCHLVAREFTVQYRHTLSKYRVIFKGTNTIKSLLKHPKDPIPDAQKTDIIYHWKCPAHNCTAEYIGETNRSLKEEFHTTEFKPPVPSEITTSPQNTQKENLKILQ